MMNAHEIHANARHDLKSAGRYVIRALWGSFPVTLMYWTKREDDPLYRQIQTVWAWEDEPAQMARVETMDRLEAHRVMAEIQAGPDMRYVHGLTVEPAAAFAVAAE